MKNIKSFCIGNDMGGSGIFCESKEEFLQYLNEEIDRVDKEGDYEHFDITIDLNNN